MNYNLIEKGTDITRIDISFGSVKKLPILPLKLEKLYADNNPELEEFPIIPSTLLILSICLTGVSVLPPLPNTLQELYISDNPGIIVQWLPDSLKIFIANSCELDYIPELPSELITLSVDANYLEKLPRLPNTLKTLVASNNELDHLSTCLPNELTICLVQNNVLKTLPSLPHTLLELNCAENCLSMLPHIPPKIVTFIYFGNPLLYDFHEKTNIIEKLNNIHMFVKKRALSTISQFIYSIVSNKRKMKKQIYTNSSNSLCSLSSIISIDPWTFDAEEEEEEEFILI